MKTKYQFNRFQRRSRRWFGPKTLAIIASGFILVWLGSFLFPPLEAVVLRATAPLRLAGDNFFGQLSRVAGAWRERKSLALENFELKRQLLEREAALSDYQELAVENRLLRQQLGLTTADSPVTLARLTSYPWTAPFDLVLGALPPNHQVTAGDPVTFQRRVFAGVVESVAGEQVKIKLLSAPGVRLAVLVGENRVPAEAVGRGSGDLSISLPSGLEVTTGEPVLAVGRTDLLLVGTVGSVDKEPGESLQTILVGTPINLSFVRYLEIHDR